MGGGGRAHAAARTRSRRPRLAFFGVGRRPHPVAATPAAAAPLRGRGGMKHTSTRRLSLSVALRAPRPSSSLITRPSGSRAGRCRPRLPAAAPPTRARGGRPQATARRPAPRPRGAAPSRRNQRTCRAPSAARAGAGRPRSGRAGRPRQRLPLRLWRRPEEEGCRPPRPRAGRHAAISLHIAPRGGGRRRARAAPRFPSRQFRLAGPGPAPDQRRRGSSATSGAAARDKAA